MNINEIILVLCSSGMLVATIVIAWANIRYYKIADRNLKAMKVYLKLMNKQADIMLTSSPILGSMGKEEKERFDMQRSNINAEILEEINDV